MEELKRIRRRLNRGRMLNRRLQFYIEYKVRLNVLPVIYVKPRGASSLCPICGEKLSPNGYRRMRCLSCSQEEDRDIIAVKNLLRRYQTDVGAFHPFTRKLSHDRRREDLALWESARG
jgi:putative transposase